MQLPQYMPAAPAVMGVHPALLPYAERLSKLVRKHSHYFKMTSKWYKEAIVTRGAPQARVANNAVYLYALSASLSKMDHLLRSGAHGVAFEKDRAAFEHAFDLFELMIHGEIHEMQHNADDSMLKAAAANGWIDGEKVMLESLMAFRRAGCDGVLTYFAPRVARILNG